MINLKFLFILILAFSFEFNLNAQIENDPTMIAFYPFDGNGNDISGNGFNATLIGPSTYITDRNGNQNAAFSFDGSTNYFLINNVNSTFKPTQFPVSICAWLKIPQDFQGVFTFFKNDFALDIYSGIRGNVDVTGQIQIGIENGGSIGPASRKTKTATTNIKDNQWHLITCIVRGYNNMDIYVDCHNDGGTYSGTGTTLFYESQNSGIIGAYDGILGDSDLSFSTGGIDDLFFIKRELVENEIQSLFLNQELAVTGDTIICEGQSTVLTAQGGSSYLWENGSIDASRVISNPGLYSVVINYSGSCSKTVNINVISAPLPIIPIITASGSLNFPQGESVILNSTVEYAYQWHPNLENTQSITVMQSGDYWVEVYNEFGCSSSSDITKVNVIMGLSPNYLEDLIPSWKLLKVYSLTGQLVLSKKIFVENEQQINLQLDQLGKGFFLIYLHDDKQFETFRIMNH